MLQFLQCRARTIAVFHLERPEHDNIGSSPQVSAVKSPLGSSHFERLILMPILFSGQWCLLYRPRLHHHLNVLPCNLRRQAYYLYL